MGWTLSFERACLVCQRIWRENHHWFVTSKHCCCCYWSIYNAFFFSVLQNISRLPRTFDPVRLTDFVSQSCEKFKRVWCAEISVRRQFKLKFRFNYQYEQETNYEVSSYVSPGKETLLLSSEPGPPAFNSDLSVGVQDWNSHHYGSFTL